MFVTAFKRITFALLLGLMTTTVCVAQDGDDMDLEADLENTGGVEVDALGVLTNLKIPANAHELDQKRLQAAAASLNQDIQQPSNFRKVSLTRLEAEVAKLRAVNKPIPADMAFLGGLTQITHVFFYPETKDVVVAGPAEGIYINGLNRAVGMKTGRAAIQLQDLVVALRAFAPNGPKTQIISCSFDPTQEGLQRMQKAMQHVAKNFRPGDEEAVVNLYKEATGYQTITIKGVSPKTHFAHTMAEADYAMKLIGLGLRDTPVKITTFVDKTKPRFAKSNALTRWFFQPDYSCVHMTEDKRSMQLVGNGVKLVGEDESVSAAGNRKGRGAMNPASKAFTSSFTRMYGKLAEQDPLFAELRNLIDLSIVAAFIQKMDFYSQADWELATFGDESIVPVENRYPLKKVAPVINAFYKGSSFMTPIAGGVSIQPRVALNSDRINLDETGDIQKTRDSVAVDLLEDGQWWWD